MIPLRPLTNALPVTPAPAGEAEQAARQPTPIFGTATLNLPEWPLVLVFGGIFVSMGVVLLDSFRRGAIAFAISLALAFFLRLVLTDREAGMLKVRSRVIDLCVLGGFAGAMLVTAFWVPAPG